MKKKIDLSKFPAETSTYHHVYFADLGNGTTEIGNTNNLRGTMYRYLNTEDDCQGVWISKGFGGMFNTPDANADSPFVGVELNDWEMGYFSCLEFANRAAVQKVAGSESRFLVLPIRCLVGWALHIGITGTHYIF